MIIKAKRYCRRHALEHDGRDAMVDVVAVVLCHEARGTKFEEETNMPLSMTERGTVEDGPVVAVVAVVFCHEALGHAGQEVREGHALEPEGRDPVVDVVAVVLCHEALEHEGSELL